MGGEEEEGWTATFDRQGYPLTRIKRILVNLLTRIKRIMVNPHYKKVACPDNVA